MESPQKKQRHKKLLIFLIVVSTISLGLGFRFWQQRQKNVEKPIYTATRKDLVHQLSITGKVLPIESMVVTAPQEGRILEILVQSGALVNKDDVLYTMQLESRGQQDLLRQENEVRQLSVQVEAAEANISELRTVRDLIASASFIKEETELERLKLQLSEARERFEVSRQEMGLQRKGANNRGGMVTIRAPRSGIITLIDKRPGDYVGSGTVSADGSNDRTVMVIADLSRLMVRTRVMEADLRYVKRGLPVAVKLEAYPDSQYHGKVLIIGGQGRTDKSAGYTYFDVDVSLDSPDARVLPEMNATVELTFDKREQALALPVAGVAIFPDRSCVMKQDPSNSKTFTETPVKTGLVNESDVEIISGLSEGDKVQEIDFASIIPEASPADNVRVGRKGGRKK